MKPRKQARNTRFVLSQGKVPSRWDIPWVSSQQSKPNRAPKPISPAAPTSLPEFRHGEHVALQLYFGLPAGGVVGWEYGW